MGFLNHATNNIIIDAVLTERGRELLARNDGSFNISSFVFGDDEVDYSIVKKYGITIGKEKIEKNTPIFEANPNENIAIKHPLISFPNPLKRLTQIPTLKWSNRSSGETKIDLFDTKSSDNSDAGVTKSVTIKNNVNGVVNGELDENITDSRLFIKVHGSLLKLSAEEVVDTDINGIDTYSIVTFNPKDPEWSNQIGSEFTVYSNGVVSATDFKQFASISNSNLINTSIQIIGASSGATLVIPVAIQKRATS
jgi:hypothetical protein